MKFRWCVLMSISAWVLAWGVAGAAADNSDDPRIARGFAIAPVPLHFAPKDRAAVGLGSYLVNAVGGCNDCHTNPSYLHGGNPFLGEPKKVNAAHYLAGGQQFGPFTSRNLTPEENGRPAGLHFSQFVQVMRHGTDFDHAHPQFGPLLQVMPWPTYQSMITSDLHAIYEYLKAIPPAAPCTFVDPGAADPTCRP